jgi:hypothetical protein
VDFRGIENYEGERNKVFKTVLCLRMASLPVLPAVVLYMAAAAVGEGDAILWCSYSFLPPRLCPTESWKNI